MAHFAEIDSNNKVIRVLVVPNSEEHRGQEYLAQDCGLGGRWIQTSYNNSIRGYFAGFDFTYDEVNDVFIPPRPHTSWSWNSSLSVWEAPIPKPIQEGVQYVWDEQNQVWEAYT
jgi:hypothetical protein